MPKLTKAEKAAMLEKEFAERQALAAEQYLPKLMTALEEATIRNNFELTVRNGQFVLRDRDAESWDHRVFAIGPTYSMDNDETLCDFGYELAHKIAQREEAHRKAEAKAAALSKLTKEERELLGL